ncbi:MAG: Transcription antitermination protein RfaH [Sodalis sp.]|nr:MAG: Transcription antitermination protein RfaH [Sodalis sp.]
MAFVRSLQKLSEASRTETCEPLFPNYLFIEFDPKTIHATISGRGVHFMPVIILTEVIQELRDNSFDNVTNPETPSNTRRQGGDHRRVFEG